MKIGLIDVEEWRDIEGYDGLYKISNLGNIKSYKTNRLEGKLLKPSFDKKGYLVINLFKNDHCKNCKIHRLVAIAFIGMSDKKCVCHIDNRKTNNNVTNLLWGTDLENNKQARQDGLFKNEVKVMSLDKNGNKIKYISQCEAQRITKVSQQNISKCINGLRKTAGGLIWLKLD